MGGGRFSPFFLDIIIFVAFITYVYLMFGKENGETYYSLIAVFETVFVCGAL